MSDVIFEVRDHVAILTLNRPERGNALGGTVHEEMIGGWERVKQDKEIRVAIITAAGERHFCTGADAGGLAKIGDRQDERAEKAGGKRQTAMDTVAFTPFGSDVQKPTFCAINGVVAAAGFHFLSDSDFAICADHATFLDPHVTVGQVSGLEMVGLIRRVPFGDMMRMALTGRWERMNAQRALEIGLVTEVVPKEKLMDRALEIANMIARNSPAAIVRTRRAIWESLDRGLHDGLEHGWELIQEHWGHPDQLEGPRAFGEKREPDWEV